MAFKRPMKRQTKLNFGAGAKKALEDDKEAEELKKRDVCFYKLLLINPDEQCIDLNGNRHSGVNSVAKDNFDIIHRAFIQQGNDDDEATDPILKLTIPMLDTAYHVISTRSRRRLYDQDNIDGLRGGHDCEDLAAMAAYIKRRVDKLSERLKLKYEALKKSKLDKSEVQVGQKHMLVASGNHSSTTVSSSEVKSDETPLQLETTTTTGPSAAATKTIQPSSQSRQESATEYKISDPSLPASRSMKDNVAASVEVSSMHALVVPPSQLAEEDHRQDLNKRPEATDSQPAQDWPSSCESLIQLVTPVMPCQGDSEPAEIVETASLSGHPPVPTQVDDECNCEPHRVVLDSELVASSQKSATESKVDAGASPMSCSASPTHEIGEHENDDENQSQQADAGEVVDLVDSNSDSEHLESEELAQDHDCGDVEYNVELGKPSSKRRVSNREIKVPARRRKRRTADDETRRASLYLLRNYGIDMILGHEYRTAEEGIFFNIRWKEIKKVGWINSSKALAHEKPAVKRYMQNLSLFNPRRLRHLMTRMPALEELLPLGSDNDLE